MRSFLAQTIAGARFATLALILPLSLGFAACSTEDDSSERYLTIGLPAHICAGAADSLHELDVCFARLSIYDERWGDNEPESLWDSPCTAYTSDEFNLKNSPVGEGLGVYFTAYAGADCSGTPVARGFRGEIIVEEGDEPSGSWFLPVFAVGGFTHFPTFTQERRNKVGEFSCVENSDCRVAGENGEIASKIASCGDDGKCRLPPTAFPLDMKAARAFHTATRLPNGWIALVGGLGRKLEDNNGFQRFAATDETVEVFDPVTMTWFKPDLEGFQGLRMAFHSTVGLGDKRLAVIGGAQQANLKVSELGDVIVKRWLRIEFPNNFPSDRAGAGPNLSNLISSMDLGDRSSKTGTFTSPRIRTHAARIPGGKVLLTGGDITATAGVGVSPTSIASECDFSSDPPKCTNVGEISADRSGHCGFCLEQNAQSECKRLLLVGGLPESTSPSEFIADVWAADAFQPIGLGGGDLKSNVAYPTCVRSDKANINYLVGGTALLNDPPQIPPYGVVLSAGGTQLGSVKVEAGGMPSATRVHSAATVLSDGSVLVTGGVDTQGASTSHAYVINETEVTAQHAMQTARFGHTATLITTGAMAGSVLITGGMTIKADGQIVFATGAELYVLP